MTRSLFISIAAVCLGACAGAPSAPPAAVADLAPSGTLRAVINLGNAVLAKQEAKGEPGGVSVDRARGVDTAFTGPYVQIEGASLEAAAAVKQQLELDAKYLTAFVADMKASGFVAQALKRHAIEGAAVAPAGGVQPY